MPSRMPLPVVPVLGTLLTMLVVRVMAVRPGIGFYPIQGNMYRAKQSTDIRPEVPQSFWSFLDSCDAATTVSEATNITYWLVPDHKLYVFAEEENDICIHMLDPGSNGKRDRKLLMYFLCDSFCCADECCERDWPLTIIGLICITLFFATPLLCLVSCCLSRFAFVALRRRLRRTPSRSNNNCVSLQLGQKGQQFANNNTALLQAEDGNGTNNNRA